MMRALAAAACLFALSGCMTIGAFNRSTAHDAGATRVAESARYGPGERGTLDVYVSDTRTSGAPVIVFFYGGGWSGGAKADYSFAGHAFAAQGFVTVVPDYRVYPEVTFPAFVEDAATALRWTQDNIARFGGDPNRVVLVGHSAGAHIATLVALDPRYAQAAGFNRRAIRGIAGLAGPYGFNSFEMPLLRNVFGPPEDPLTVQPVHYVSRNGPPLLLLQGDRDARVPMRSLTSMESAARAAGEPVETQVYAGIDHGGIVQALAPERRDAAPVLRDVVQFARRVTGVTVAGSTSVGGTH